MDERKKIAFACFIGGCLCTSVALLVVPEFWWFGVLAGLISGYLAYDFKEVILAIPKVIKASYYNSTQFINLTFDDIIDWLTDPHPFIYPGIVISIYPIYLFILETNIMNVSELFSKNFSSGVIYIVVTPLMIAVIGFVCVMISAGVVALFSFIGSNYWEKVEWYNIHEIPPSKEKLQELAKEGLSSAEITYLRAYRWFIKGILFSFFFISIRIPLAIAKFFFIGFIPFAFEAAWYLFKLIHSKERVLCSLDGTIGGVVTYFLFTPRELPIHQQIVIVLFGGILGTGFGILNWEIVSKRILKVQKVQINK